MPALESIHVSGFKSFASIDLDLSPGVNVLVGANGSGKSNFVSLFRLMEARLMLRQSFYVGMSGGAARLLYYGPKVTPSIGVKFRFGNLGYDSLLRITTEDTLVFEEEALFRIENAESLIHPISGGRSESGLFQSITDAIDDGGGIPYQVFLSLVSWKVYHFHDTSANASVKLTQPLADDRTLKSDAANLAPFLHSLRSRDSRAYKRIISAVRRMFPQFGEFVLDPLPGEETIRLLWREAGSDVVFGPNQLSDGTLRFACLATLLLQPDPPTTLLVDEPELGLHPAALALLAELVREAAERCQVILTTQSVTFLDAFAPEEVIVVDRTRNPETGRAASTVRRLSGDEFADWLAEYTLGDLWLKNVIGGRP